MTNYTPNLATFKITGVTPFWSPADAHDEQLAQAHALLTALAAGYETCADTTESGSPFDTLTYPLKARALDGIATLVALAQHQADVALHRRSERATATSTKAEHHPNDPAWSELVSAFDEAKSQMDMHNKVKDEAPFGSPKSRAHEAKTARLCDVFDTTSARVLLTDAPDQSALRYKLQILALPEFTELNRTEVGEFAKQLAHDADRLLPQGR